MFNRVISISELQHSACQESREKILQDTIQKSLHCLISVLFLFVSYIATAS